MARVFCRAQVNTHWCCARKPGWEAMNTQKEILIQPPDGTLMFPNAHGKMLTNLTHTEDEGHVAKCLAPHRYFLTVKSKKTQLVYRIKFRFISSWGIAYSSRFGCPSWEYHSASWLFLLLRGCHDFHVAQICLTQRPLPGTPHNTFIKWRIKRFILRKITTHWPHVLSVGMLIGLFCSS